MRWGLCLPSPCIRPCLDLRFDYNCDGVATQQYTAVSTTKCLAGGRPPFYTCTGSGWVGITSPPACGATADYQTCLVNKLTGACTGSVAKRTQACR
jgi:hypothetical protein